MIQSIYMDDIEGRSSPRFEERFECIGRSIHNITANTHCLPENETGAMAAQMTMRDIECQVQDERDKSPVSAKRGSSREVDNNIKRGRLITRHLTGQLPATKKPTTMDDVSVPELVVPTINEQPK